MILEQAKKLVEGDRVLFDAGRYGYEDSIITEISPSGKFVLWSYHVFSDSLAWKSISVIQERLVPLPPTKKGWFR